MATDKDVTTATEAPATTDTTDAVIAEGGSPGAAAAAIENEEPISADVAFDEGLQSDLASRYGDVLPDVIEELLPAGTVPVVAEGGGEADPQPEGGTAPSTDGGTTPEPVTTITQPEEGGQLDELAQARVVIQQLTSLVQGQQIPGQQPAVQPEVQGEQTPNPLEVVPEYDFEIPDQLLTMMASEDVSERKQAMGALTKGIAQTIHQQTMSVVADVIKTLQTDMPQNITQQLQQQQRQERIGNDFYNKYPNLNNESLKPVVGNVAKQLMQQDLLVGIQPNWTPEFMERVAQGVQELLGQTVTPAPIADPAPTPAKVPATFGGNAGGGAVQANTLAKGMTTQQDHINDLFT